MKHYLYLLLKNVLELLPLLILVSGMIGNIFNIFIFFKLRHTSTFRFLFYLSIADLIVLFLGATELVLKINYSFESSIVSCNTHKFLTYTSTYISTFLSIAMNVDRALKVSSMTSLNDRSNKKLSLTSFSHRYVKKRLVDVICFVIVLVTFLLNIHFIVVFKPMTFVFFDEQQLNSNNRTFDIYEIKTCIIENNSLYESFLIEIWFWIDMTLFSILPFFSIAACSLVITKKMNKINKNYTSCLCNINNIANSGSGDGGIANQSSFNKSIYKRKLRRNFQLCFMLILSNLYFLLTMSIFWLWVFFHLNSRTNFKSNTSDAEFFYTNLTQSYVFVLLYSNNALGFVFYGVSSVYFRREFAKLFRFKCFAKLSHKNLI
jgi:hypothetical protein